MLQLASLARRGGEAVVALLMAAMFAAFVLQIVVRYSGRVPAIAEALPFLDPSGFGWTLEFCLLVWVWLVFLGCAFAVREQDHVTFDLLVMAVGPRARRVMLVVGGLVVAVAFLAAVGPTWEKFAILRLKKTATLGGLFGDWLRVRHIYAVTIVFLVAVALRGAWAAFSALRGEAVAVPGIGPGAHPEHRLDE